jgi:hypothetical protein
MSDDILDELSKQQAELDAAAGKAMQDGPDDAELGRMKAEADFSKLIQRFNEGCAQMERTKRDIPVLVLNACNTSQAGLDGRLKDIEERQVALKNDVAHTYQAVRVEAASMRFLMHVYGLAVLALIIGIACFLIYVYASAHVPN